MKKSKIPKAVLSEQEKMDAHEIERMADTMLAAEAIKMHPNKMKAVQEHLGRKQQAIKSIQDLRDMRQKLVDENNEKLGIKPVKSIGDEDED